MTISGITSSLLSSGLFSSGASTQQPAQVSTTAGGVDSTPAYQLALGQQQSQSALLGYGALGKLVNQAGASLADMDTANPNVSVADGTGKPLMETHSIDVQQLAQAQVVTSGGYASASQTIAATGTLTLQQGTYESASDSFIATGDPVAIPIGDGSLNGIAASINAAGAGLSASVVKGSDGTFELQVTGQTGADSAFQLSGIAALAYDPAAPSFTGLQASQSAQDAQYTVNGGAVQTSPSNTDVAVISGITANLSATGAMTVSVPFGFNQASGAARTLATSVNTLLGGLQGLTGQGNELAGDTGPASQLLKVIDQALSQTSSGGSSLADIGVTVQQDGTLAVDQGKLQSAFTSDPSGTRALIDQAAAAVRQALSGSGQASDQISTQLKTFVAHMMAQIPSLAEILGISGSDSSQQTSDPFGQSTQSSQSGQLAALAGQGPSSSSDLSGLSGLDPSLLAALGQSVSTQA
jgi:flagellar hook-associated protein 2